MIPSHDLTDRACALYWLSVSESAVSRRVDGRRAHFGDGTRCGAQPKARGAFPCFHLIEQPIDGI